MGWLVATAITCLLLFLLGNNIYGFPFEATNGIHKNIINYIFLSLLTIIFFLSKMISLILHVWIDLYISDSGKDLCSNKRKKSSGIVKSVVLLLTQFIAGSCFLLACFNNYISFYDRDQVNLLLICSGLPLTAMTDPIMYTFQYYTYMRLKNIINE